CTAKIACPCICTGNCTRYILYTVIQQPESFYVGLILSQYCKPSAHLEPAPARACLVDGIGFTHAAGHGYLLQRSLAGSAQAFLESVRPANQVACKAKPRHADFAFFMPRAKAAAQAQPIAVYHPPARKWTCAGQCRSPPPAPG